MVQDIFVGRENEQESYRNFIDGDEAWMLTITGLGGIGKSSLLKRLAHLTPSDTPVVTLNFADDMNLRTNSLNLLEFLARPLKFSTNEEQYTAFIQLLQQNHEQIEQRQSQAKLYTQTSSAPRQAGEDHTVATIVPDDASVLAQKIQQALQEVQYQLRETATDAFYELLDTLQPAIKRLVIMFDTCEMLNDSESWETRQWLMNNFLPRLQMHMQHRKQRCFAVMVGRVQLSSEVIDEQEQQHIVLSMLNEQEANRYLELAGMRNPVTRQHVYEITHGHALCIAIIRAFYQEPGQPSLDSIDASTLQENFDEHLSLEFINERILNNLASPLRELTQFGVLLRSFDLPTLKAVFPDLLPEEHARNYFEQFIRYPYIEVQGHYRYTFHELVREVLTHKTQKDHPQQWIHYHENALTYFSKGTGIAQRTEPSVEWYYHALALAVACGQEEQGIAAWQQAVQEARNSKMRQDVVALLQIAYDHTIELTPASCAIREFEQARSYTYIQQWSAAHKHYEQARTFFEQAQDQHGQANVLKALGDLQRDQDKRDTALLYYQRAQELYAAIDDSLGQARVLQAIGNIKHLRNELDEALLSYEQAFSFFTLAKDYLAPIEVCLGQAEAYKSIADIQRQQNQGRTALRSYSRAISLYEDAGSDIGKAEATRARDELSATLEREQKREKNSFVYICYARADRAFVTQLKDDLQVKGINVFYDQENILPGSFNWEEQLRQEIRDASTILFIASPRAISSRYVRDELAVAKVYQRPVYPLWIDGESWFEAIPFGFGNIQYVDARKGKYREALEQVIDILNQAVPSIPTRSSGAKLLESAFPIAARNPYKGLRAFTPEDAKDFFGREKLVKEILSKLQHSLMIRSESSRLLSIIGPSGSGKSSVVMAGLLPQLQRGALPDSEQWIYLNPIMPGAHPLEALAAALAQLPGLSFTSIREDLGSDSARGLHLLSSLLVSQNPGQQVVLFIDQFEELFTQTTSENERRQFIDLITTAATEPKGSLIVILTLRADFYDRPMAYPSLFKLLNTQFTSVLAMDGEELRAAIERSASLPDVQITFEDGLVDELLFESRGQPGSLPLLQFTLDLLFQHREDNVLTLQAYHEIGGMTGALSKHAEEVYQTLLSDEHRVMARVLFLRLIEVGPTEQDITRRRALGREFKLSSSTQTAQLHSVIEAFTVARLLTVSKANGITTVELSHEAIVRAWPRLQAWLQATHEDILFQRTISIDVEAWEQRGKPVDRLYRGSQLREAQEWVSRNIPSQQEDEFIRASRKHIAHSLTRYGYLEHQAPIRSSRRFILISLMLVICVGIFSIVLTPFNHTASFSNLTVTNLDGNGSGSFRQVIADAPAFSTITFVASLNGIITLKNSELVLTKNLTISGAGADKLAISGGQGGDIRIASGATVTISGLAFKDSSADSSIIVNEGSLTLTSTTIADNKVSSPNHGGALTNRGTLTLKNSLITGNQSMNGGGIYNDSGSTITIQDTIISNNHALRSGGGIFNTSGTMDLTNSTVSYNDANNLGGGFFSTNGTMVFVRSTLSYNKGSNGVNEDGTLIFNGGEIKGNIP